MLCEEFEYGGILNAIVAPRIALMSAELSAPCVSPNASLLNGPMAVMSLGAAIGGTAEAADPPL